MMPVLIGLDWGTTNLRAYLIARDGATIEQRTGGPGIMQVSDGRFENALTAFCGDWISAHQSVPLIASGMIGSKQGWREAPYCPCRADTTDIAGSMARVVLAQGRTLRIVPGVSTVNSGSGVPDVMRGEETQIIGAVPQRGSHLVVLPGTHSKWAWISDGAIVNFSSWMTGEIYAALINHTILGRLMTPEAAHDQAAFDRGVRYGFERPGQLLSRLFSARTLGLFGQLDATALPSYLSGLLIGAEIGGATEATADSHTLLLLGNRHLTGRYASACELLGLAATCGPEDSAALGMHRLARALAPMG